MGIRRAFTLIETLIVIGIISSILVLTSMIMLYRYHSDDEALFITQFQRFLNRAQMLAIVSRKPVEIRFDSKNKTYYIKGREDISTVALPQTIIYFPRRSIEYRIGGKMEVERYEFVGEKYRYIFQYQFGPGHFHYEQKPR